MNKKTIMLLAALALGGATAANAATPATTSAKTQTAKPKHVAQTGAKHAAKPHKTQTGG